jgi:zinc metalloprotease ZmpB
MILVRVSAYYHLTELFKTIESLGFPITSYFNGTTFPIPVDHRALLNDINAHWSPNGRGGTEHLCYGLCDTTNTANPLLRAVDPWVHWHEMGGHGTLGDHVGGGTFGFCHSAGDGLAAIQMDPESQLRTLGMPERFRYAPFRPFTTERRFDRPVATWAWGGPNDDQGYGSEQILATCHFRIYRSIGGDHSNLGRRQFASRAATYLILRATGALTPSTNPSNRDPVTGVDVPGRGAQLWCEVLQVADLKDWISEGLAGGAYNKVIRWAFEKQGSYQPAGAPANVTTEGAPPAVDVYIEDGRHGEYPFQAIHWQNMSIWNRNSPDTLPTHQNAIAATTNFMYGKVKNRGTTTATNVTVRCFHCLAGAGLTWPTDFTEMAPVGGITIPSIGANNSQEVMVGPFEWTPNVNALGHDCVLMIASAAGDPSNIDNFTGTESIAEWRLVPNDNNIGQRNVVIVPGSPEALAAAFDNAIFFAGNSFNKTATMELRAELPDLLSAKGWKLHFAEVGNDQFRLRPGEKRVIKMRLAPGAAFSADEIRQLNDRFINVYLTGNGIEVGGMSYQIDPDATGTLGEAAVLNVASRRAAMNLLERLNVPAQPVGNVRIRKVSVDIEFD